MSTLELSFALSHSLRDAVERDPSRAALAGLPLLALALLTRSRRRGVLDYGFDFPALRTEVPVILAQLTERNDGA